MGRLFFVRTSCYRYDFAVCSADHSSCSDSATSYPEFVDVLTSVYFYYNVGSYNTELTKSSGSATFYYI